MNTVQLIGNLTRDPELRFTNGGTAVCTIPLAINRRKRNGDDQEPVYVDVVTWGAQAENVAQDLTKGRRVAVAGRLEFRRWTDAEARSHAKHEVVASEVQFLDPPRKGEPHRPNRPTPPARSPSSRPSRAGQHIAARLGGHRPPRPCHARRARCSPKSS